MYQKFRMITIILMTVIIIPSCATLFTGTTDDIYISSNPGGADILIDGLKVGKTPTTITVKRPGFSDKEVVLKLDGYERRHFILKKSFNAVSILNLAGIGWIVDFATGALFKYDPKTYEIDLDPETYKIEDLKIDIYGKIKIPNSDKPIMVVDNELGMKILFK